MTTYKATIIDLFWRESFVYDIAAITEQEAIDEASEYVDLTSLVLSEIKGDDGTHISFDLPTDIPVHDVDVLIDDEGKALETQVPSCTIDGVPPLGLATQMRIFVDPDLLQYAEVWAAAGTWNHVFPIDPAKLAEVSDGLVVDIGRKS
jgi:hypothetical protein